MTRFLLVFLLLTLVSADNIKIYGSDYIFRSCNSEIWKLGTFCKAKNLYEESYRAGESYECYCSNKNGLATLMGCLAIEGFNDEVMYRKLSAYCEEFGQNVSSSDFKSAYQTYLLSAKDATTDKNYDTTKPVDYPIKLVDTHSVIVARDAYKAFYGNFNNSLYFGAGCLAYWALIALISTIVHWGYSIFPGSRMFFNGPISRNVRRYVNSPALFNQKKNVSQRFLWVFDFLIPTRLESAVIFGFFSLCMILCAVNIPYVDGQTIYPTKEIFVTRLVADRTGIICSMLTPLFIMFAGRNNVLQFFTGWKASTLFAYHRWVARMVVLMAFVHSVCFTYIYVDEVYYTTAMKEAWLRWGVVATTAGGIICFQGLLTLRRNFYETFLIVHILLAIFWVVGMWYHLSDMGYQQLVYPAMAVWAFDRILRVVRLIWFGFPEAEVTWLLGDTLKVEVPKPSSWPSVPGGHAWVHFAHSFYFFQSHPFTFIDSPTKKDTIVFFCKVKGGVTKSLVEMLHQKPGKTMRMRVSVDGPYGYTSPVKNYSNIVYVAGGSGISGVYAEAVSMARKVANEIRRVELVWILQDFASVAGFHDEIEATRDNGLMTTIYVTRPETFISPDMFLNRSNLESLDEKFRVEQNVKVHEKGQEGALYDKYLQGEMSKSIYIPPSSENSSDDAYGLAGLKYEYPHVDFHVGRPNLQAIVARETEHSASSVAFVACGHPILIDDLRHSVVEAMSTTQKRVDFYEQLEVWA